MSYLDQGHEGVEKEEKKNYKKEIIWIKKL